MSQSVVRWNGAARTTTYVSSTQLKAAITAADIALAGTGTVTVYNPAPGGGTSNNSTFSISYAPLNIGETNVLSLSDSGNGNAVVAQQVSLTQSANIVSLSFYVATASGNMRLGIYDATGPGGGPGQLKAQTAGFTPTTGWNTKNVTSSVSLSSGTYWLAFVVSSNNLVMKVTTSGSAKYYTYTYGALPATFSTAPQSGAFHWSYYATMSQAAPVLTSISLSPTSATVAAGGKQQYTATAKDQFGNNISPPTLTWSVSGGGTIDAAGLFTAGSTAGGPYTVTASSGAVSGTASVSVTAAPPVLTTITVSPASASVTAGGTQQYTATGKDQFGNTLSPQPTFTWTVSGGGTISAAGLFTAGTTAGGPYTVTAASGGVSGTASVTVTASAPFTIGETSVLSIGDAGNSNAMVAQQATLSKTATIQSMSFYVTTTGGNLRLGIYDATGPGGGPGQLKAQTAEFTPVAGWNTKNVTSSVSLPAGNYWLAFLPSSDALGYRVAASGSAKYYAYTYGALPTTFSTAPLSGNYHWSFYATLQ